MDVDRYAPRRGRMLFLRALRSIFNGRFAAKLRRRMLLCRPVCRLLARFAQRRPVDPRKVVFASLSGGVSCNPKYIALELLRRRDDLDVVWLVEGSPSASGLPRGARAVPLWSIGAIREMATAKVLVENAQQMFLFNVAAKRPGQSYFNTWHGSLGIKRLSTASRRVRETAERLSAAVDAVLTNSAFEEGVFRESLFPRARMLRLGHARNDVFFWPEERKAPLRARVRAAAGLAEGERLALYAPTFRESAFFTAAGGLRFGEWARAFSDRFGGVWRIAVRLHPHDARGLEEGLFSLPADVLNLSSYDDVQELLVAADACVTDYSSLIFDYLLGGGPGFVFAPDKAKYDESRGFCYPLEETPFPIAETEGTLCANIRAFDAAKYAADRETFLKAHGCYERGDASARAADWIEGKVSSVARRRDNAQFMF